MVAFSAPVSTRAIVAFTASLAIAIAVRASASGPAPTRQHGFIAPGTLDPPGTAPGEHRFVLTNCGRSIDVRTRGPLPDPVRDYAEVAVEGAFDDEQYDFVATTVIAKCPSKYDAHPPAPRVMCR